MNPEGLNCGDMLVSVSQDLRLSTVVLSQDLSGAWVTVQG
jgi:hypothetical protein